MARPPTHLTMLLLVDALRADYVERTRFLKRLAVSSATGVLRECFGFVPRAAYFGGLTVEQSGFTNMYCFDPAASPFSMAGTLPCSQGGAAVERRVGVRQVLEQTARERLTPFAKAYASSAEIPLRFLPYFDLVEKRAPWDKHVGYQSLFALLDEHGLPWYQCSWPGSNKLTDHSDEGIVNEVLEELRPEHRFAYVHLQELDGIGHAFGPNSAELQKHLAATDLTCQRLVETVRGRYDTFDLVLFGDHGMVNVTRTLDVGEALEATGLKFGIDYAFFLDSTMARFWFYHARARRQVESVLSNLPGGRLLGAGDLKRYGIAGCDSRNAELIFLAHPGVLIFPNFFQSQGEPIKGMHGYDPDCPDNLGFFLFSSSSDSHLAGSSMGKVDPPMLFPLLQRLIGLPEAQMNRSPMLITSAGAKGRFTSHPDAAADEMVRLQLDQITKEVEARVGSTKAIVLTGSFGRGEGGVFRDATGRYRPVNDDYDLLVVDPRNLGSDLKKLGDELAERLGIDFIDLGCSDGHWEQLPLSVQHYDLKYGSQVIAGDPNVLEQIPAYASADLPVYEAVKLLLNRSAGLLSGLRGEFLTGAEPTAEQGRYLTNQIVKVLMAMGDWHLIRWEGYDSSYRLRAERLQALAAGAGLPEELAEKITQAYRFKCRPDYDGGMMDGGGRIMNAAGAHRSPSILHHPSSTIRPLAGFYPDLELALVQSINLHTESHAKSLSAAMTVYLESMSADASWVAADNAHCASHPEIERILKPGALRRFSLRHLVYSALPFIVAAASDPNRAGTAFSDAVARLETCFRLPAAQTFNPQAWEELRALVVQAWFAICH